MPEENVIQFRADEDLRSWLTDRGTRTFTGATGKISLTARAELALHRMLLAGELRKIRLTLGQLLCLADVLNGHMLHYAAAGSVGIVWAECSDAFRLARETPLPDPELSSYGRKWGIDEQALLAYLDRLGPAADHALQDAISRWWDQDLDDTAEGFAKVGLRAIDPPTPPHAEKEPSHDR